MGSQHPRGRPGENCQLRPRSTPSCWAQQMGALPCPPLPLDGLQHTAAIPRPLCANRSFTCDPAGHLLGQDALTGTGNRTTNQRKRAPGQGGNHALLSQGWISGPARLSRGAPPSKSRAEESKLREREVKSGRGERIKSKTFHTKWENGGQENHTHDFFQYRFLNASGTYDVVLLKKQRQQEPKVSQRAAALDPE